jgi:hypothetical protein
VAVDEELGQQLKGIFDRLRALSAGPQIGEGCEVVPLEERRLGVADSLQQPSACREFLGRPESQRKWRQGKMTENVDVIWPSSVRIAERCLN